jgi:hypothetical protein
MDFFTAFMASSTIATLILGDVQVHGNIKTRQRRCAGRLSTRFYLKESDCSNTFHAGPQWSHSSR